MKAKEFIYSRSQELAEAIDNGYDLRLSEPDILYWMEKYAEYKAKNLPIHNVSASLLERAASLVGNPGTNISGSTDLACDEWQKDYERWHNEC